MGGVSLDELDAPGDPALSQPAQAPQAGTLAARPPYTFFPQTGTQGRDLFIINYVDLSGSLYDIGKPGLDYECTTYSYLGHNGHDSGIEGFRVQDISVPVFAALNGTIYDAHDGEDDHQTVNLQGRPANYVTLSHGSGY